MQIILMVGGKEKLISTIITGLHLAELHTYIGLEVAALTCYRAEKNAHLHFCETLSFSKGDLLPVLSLVMEHVVTVREGASLNILFQSNIKKSVHWISSKVQTCPESLTWIPSLRRDPKARASPIAQSTSRASTISPLRPIQVSI